MRSLPRNADGKRRPQFVVVIELEELPRLHFVADTFEDEQRLRGWLGQRATRRLLIDALLDAFEEAA